MVKLDTNLDRQLHNEQYPFILHWTQLPATKETIEWVAQTMINVIYRMYSGTERCD